MRNRVIFSLIVWLREFVKQSFSKRGKRVILASVVALIVLSVGYQSYAQTPTAAFIFKFAGGGLQIGKESSAGSPVKGKETLGSGNVLSIAGDSTSQASLGFVLEGKQNSGILVRTGKQSRPSRYRFPCSGGGNLTIGWRPQGTRHEICGTKKGWNIEREKSRTVSFLPNSDQTFSLIPASNTKQIDQQDEQQNSESLEIAPNQGQTLIQTRNGGTFTLQDLGSCNLNTGRCTDRSGSVDLGTCSLNTGRCTNKLETVEDITVVDVVLGDISVKSQDDSVGTQVKQGESFVYPGGEVKPIDVASTANSCEILEFLNPAYWSPSDVSKSVMDGVYEQLKEHREALGVSGREGSLSALERGVADEMNLARTNPIAYADLLAKLRPYYKGNRLELPGKVPLITNEGGKAVDGAIAFLRSISSLPPLSVSIGMSRASKDLVKVQGPGGGLGHDASDGSGSESRLKRYGAWGCKLGENISYGSNTARDVVMQLIIDDGQQDRGHRNNIFDRDFQVTGVGCGSHSRYDSMCSINYAGGYIERN